MGEVVLIDYGSGNLRSAENALRRVAADGDLAATIVASNDPDRVARADRLVLPGVGAFAACMAALAGRSGLIEAMREAAQVRGAPFLGVCVGMQLLATRGLEFGETAGLDWIPGETRRLSPAQPGAKVPHTGWNDVVPGTIGALAPRTPTPFYFTHSFCLHPEDRRTVTAEADHGGVFVAAVESGNIAGVQFHPEKSQTAGLALLERFLRWRP
jgi:glutamine amidotransferase